MPPNFERSAVLSTIASRRLDPAKTGVLNADELYMLQLKFNELDNLVIEVDRGVTVPSFEQVSFAQKLLSLTQKLSQDTTISKILNHPIAKAICSQSTKAILSSIKHNNLYNRCIEENIGQTTKCALATAAGVATDIGLKLAAGAMISTGIGLTVGGVTTPAGLATAFGGVNLAIHSEKYVDFAHNIVKNSFNNRESSSASLSYSSLPGGIAVEIRDFGQTWTEIENGILNLEDMTVKTTRNGTIKLPRLNKTYLCEVLSLFNQGIMEFSMTYDEFLGYEMIDESYFGIHSISYKPMQLKTTHIGQVMTNADVKFKDLNFGHGGPSALNRESLESFQIDYHKTSRAATKHGAYFLLQANDVFLLGDCIFLSENSNISAVSHGHREKYQNITLNDLKVEYMSKVLNIADPLKHYQQLCNELIDSVENFCKSSNEIFNDVWKHQYDEFAELEELARACTVAKLLFTNNVTTNFVNKPAPPVKGITSVHNLVEKLVCPACNDECHCTEEDEECHCSDNCPRCTQLCKCGFYLYMGGVDVQLKSNCYINLYPYIRKLTDKFTFLQAHATDGCSSCQCELGCCYFEGIDTTINYELAVKYYQLAAHQSNKASEYEGEHIWCRLGYCYAFGKGVAQDDEKAVQYFKNCADSVKGCPRCQSRLGYRYIYGVGVEKDAVEAFRYYKLAADQNHYPALSSLGYFYETGQGVARDIGEAVKYYKLGADVGDAFGNCCLGVCYSKGIGVSVSDVEALKCFQRGAEKSDLASLCNLGWCYEAGLGVERSADHAAKYYKLAVEASSSARGVNDHSLVSCDGFVSYDKLMAWLTSRNIIV